MPLPRHFTFSCKLQPTDSKGFVLLRRFFYSEGKRLWQNMGRIAKCANHAASAPSCPLGRLRHPSSPFSWLVGVLSHVLKDVVMALLDAEALLHVLAAQITEPPLWDRMMLDQCRCVFLPSVFWGGPSTKHSIISRIHSWMHALGLTGEVGSGDL